MTVQVARRECLSGYMSASILGEVGWLWAADCGHLIARHAVTYCVDS